MTIPLSRLRRLPRQGSGLFALNSSKLLRPTPLPIPLLKPQTPPYFRRFLTYSLPRRPYPTPPNPRRLHPHTILLRPLSISTSTKSYLYTESILGLRLLLFGSLGLIISSSILYLGLHYYLELESPTPRVYDFITRAALHSAYHAREWDGDYARAAEALSEAVGGVEELVRREGGWEGVSRIIRGEGGKGGKGKGRGREWVEGVRAYVRILGELGAAEEKSELRRRAMGRWRRVLELGGEGSPISQWVGRGARARAAVRLGGLLDEVGEEGVLGEEEVEVEKRREKCEKEAEGLFKLAYSIAAEDAGVDTSSVKENPGVIPVGERVTKDLLDSAAELGIHYARFKRLDLALPIFLSLLRARSGVARTPETTSRGGIADPCEIGKVEGYLGEVLWAAGEKEQGVEWEKRAMNTVEGLVEERAGCRDCAVWAGGNLVVMLRKLAEEVVEGKGEKSGWGLWRRDGGVVGKRVEELEREVEVAEERLRRVLGVRIAKGK